MAFCVPVLRRSLPGCELKRLVDSEIVTILAKQPAGHHFRRISAAGMTDTSVRSITRSLASEERMPNTLERFKLWFRDRWERHICAECPKHLDYPWGPAELRTEDETVVPHSGMRTSSNMARSRSSVGIFVILRLVPYYARSVRNRFANIVAMSLAVWPRR